MAVAVHDGEKIFRTCDVTGFKVDLRAEKIARLNAVIAVVSFLIAIVAALLLILTRWQMFHLLPVDWYYRVLTLHGLDGLVFWIIFFELAALVFGSTAFLNTRMSSPALGWLGTILAIVGWLMVNYTILTGNADVLMTSYAPLKAHPLFYLGMILFAVGALVIVMVFFANLMIWRRENPGQSLPLFVYGLMAAAIIAVVTIASGAIIYIPTLLWSMGIISDIDPAVYKLVWWGLGHPSQQINVSAHVAVWYLLAFLTVGGTSINEKVSRFAFVLYILAINVASAHHLLVDPAVTPVWKVWNTSYVMYLAVFASMIHAFAVPSAIEVAQRRRGYTKGLFEWLKAAPWGNPAFSGLMLSMIIFGFIGGITGVVNGMEQTNIIVHNTLSVPGHFKGAVVGGTVLAFMSVTYYLIPLLFRKKIAFYGLAKFVPWLFGIGIAITAVSLYILGAFGIPRRHWDITFSGGPFTFTFNPVMDFFWALFGIGGIMAVIGALIWILQVVVSVFFGQPFRGPQDLQIPIAEPPPPGEEEHEGFVAPGTFVLVLLFITAFIIFVALNYGWLSAMWEVK